jgi:hypothetical protein
MRSGIGGDVPEEDDALRIETIDERGEALACNMADGEHEGLDPRRAYGQKRIDSHSCAAIIPNVRGNRAQEIERELSGQG